MTATRWSVIGCLMLLVAVGRVGGQQLPKEEELDPETKARVAKFDKGPDKIDVSKYPPEMKDTYNKAFRIKCAKCHTIARAINSDYALEDEWERYIKRMMRRAGTFIKPAEAKQIYQFVTYDSKMRKKELYDKKLKEAELAGL